MFDVPGLMCPKCHSTNVLQSMGDGDVCTCGKCGHRGSDFPRAGDY